MSVPGLWRKRGLCPPGVTHKNAGIYSWSITGQEFQDDPIMLNSSMPKRPYLQKSAAEMEAIFKAEGENPAVLAAILHELGYRSTQAADRLKKRVRFALDSKAAKAGGKSGTTSAIVVKPLQANPAVSRDRIRQPDLPSETAPQDIRVRSVAPDPEPVLTAEPEPPQAPGVTPSRAPKPKITDRPDDILAAWTTLEVLSPASIRH